MPAVAFPSLKPTSRQYTPGTFPQEVFRALNGAVTILRYGNKLTDARMTLTYNYITRDEGESILDNYHDVMKAHDWLDLSGTMCLSDDFTEWMKESEGNSPSQLHWRYNSPPRIDEILPGVVNATVELVGMLDGAELD